MKKTLMIWMTSLIMTILNGHTITLKTRQIMTQINKPFKSKEMKKLYEILFEDNFNNKNKTENGEDSL